MNFDVPSIAQDRLSTKRKKKRKTKRKKNRTKKKKKKKKKSYSLLMLMTFLSIVYEIANWLPMAIHLQTNHSTSGSSALGTTLPLRPWGAGTASWLERRTRDRKVASSNPGRSSRKIFFFRVHFVC